MSDIKTQREPILPNIPGEEQSTDYRLERRWRIGHADAFRMLHKSVREDLEGGGFRLENKTPSSASDVGEKGEICFDSSYLYICIDTDTWVREWEWEWE